MTTKFLGEVKGQIRLSDELKAALERCPTEKEKLQLLADRLRELREDDCPIKDDQWVSLTEKGRALADGQALLLEELHDLCVQLRPMGVRLLIHAAKLMLEIDEDFDGFEREEEEP